MIMRITEKLACGSWYQKFGSMAMVTMKPMNSVTSMSGVNGPQTGHSPTVKLKQKDTEMLKIINTKESARDIGTS